MFLQSRPTDPRSRWTNRPEPIADYGKRTSFLLLEIEI